VVRARGSVAFPDVDDLPITEMALPSAETGALTGAATWVPPARLRLPEVVAFGLPSPDAVVSPVPLAPVPAALPPLDDDPRTETELPSIEMGAFTGVTAWVPEPMLRVPDVVAPEPPAALLVCSGALLLEAFVVDERPSTETALPSADTGAVAGATNWVPEPMPRVPAVVMVSRLPPVLVGALLLVLFVVDERPSTETALPSADTGALTGATTCEPEPAPRVPDVVAPEPSLVEAAPEDAPELSVVDELPSTETALPSADTGALAGAMTWVPEAAPLSPLVSATAPTAPRRRNPPAVRVP
jgi:hypothetical protein